MYDEYMADQGRTSAAELGHLRLRLSQRVLVQHKD